MFISTYAGAGGGEVGGWDTSKGLNMSTSGKPA